MGMAAWLVWRTSGLRAARVTLALFLTQLALNVLWSWLFFKWHRGALAFADVLLLWVLILATLMAFWRVRALAAVLLIPYLLWVSFASALNYVVGSSIPGAWPRLCPRGVRTVRIDSAYDARTGRWRRVRSRVAVFALIVFGSWAAHRTLGTSGCHE